jgi:hypothetical protein
MKSSRHVLGWLGVSLAAACGSEATGGSGAGVSAGAGPGQGGGIPSGGNGTGAGLVGGASSGVSFEDRCADPLVIACYGFDSASETDPYLFDSGFSPPAFDGTMFAEGAGAVKMLVEAGSGPDSSGSFVLDFAPGIAPGETLYVQWRQRFNQAFLTSDFGGFGWK